MSLVAWSGGCDSTLLLAELWEEQQRLGDEQPLRAISVEHPQVECSVPQRAAQSRILERLRAGGVRIDHQIVRIGHAFDYTAESANLGGAVDTGGSIQPQVWLTLMIPYLAADEHFYLGYIRGDDVWHRWAQVQQAFNGINALGYRTGVLKAPLEWVTKAAVLNRLRERGLLDLCMYCEDASGTVCHTCGSCVVHETALWQLEQQPRMHAHLDVNVKPLAGAYA